MLPSEQKLSTQTNIRTRRKFYSAKCQTIHSRHPGYISFSIQLSRRICSPGKANPVTFFYLSPGQVGLPTHLERTNVPGTWTMQGRWSNSNSNQTKWKKIGGSDDSYKGSTVQIYRDAYKPHVNNTQIPSLEDSKLVRAKRTSAYRWQRRRAHVINWIVR
jgi:hypothetical protein